MQYFDIDYLVLNEYIFTNNQNKFYWRNFVGNQQELNKNGESYYSQVSNRRGEWNRRGLEKMSKTTSQGDWTNLENQPGGGGGLEFRFQFLSFLTIKTNYCRTFYKI